MIIEGLKRFVQLLILLAVQVLLMNHIHFFGYGTPLVYVALLLYMPSSWGRIASLVWGFVLGFLVDVFSNTPGMSAGSMTVAAFFQPLLLKAFLPKDALEDMTPNYHTMGVWNHLRYLTLILILHHITYFLLQSFSFYNLVDLGMSAGISFGLSWLFVVVIETLRGHE
ncbi:MAG: rod shape-determining protein MreD [Bacteroidaceae bacterium]|nr:rod shape-determining protein MreD [Bacteroidaceae bacterium]